jgi:hypothetical protein
VSREYITKIHKTQKKIAGTQRYSDHSLLKEFIRFLISGSCGLSLVVGHLENLWFATTQP